MHHFLINTYRECIKITLFHLKEPKAIDDLFYLLDDFLGMSTRILYNAPKLFINGQDFPFLLEFILKCMKSKAIKVIIAVHSFFHTLFIFFWNH